LEVIDKVIGGFVGEIISKNNSSASPMHGPLVIKFIISKLGNVDNCKVLVNRVASADAKDAEWRAIVEKLCEYVSVLTFPASGGSTEVTWPIILGGSLR
jgi:hypothetical protein